MKVNETCQFDFYEDFDVIPEMRLEVEGFDPGRPSTGSGGGFCDPTDDYEAWEYENVRITLNVNSTEIELPESVVNKIMAAIKVRFDNKMDDVAMAIFQDAAIRASDEDSLVRFESKRDPKIPEIFDYAFDSLMPNRTKRGA